MDKIEQIKQGLEFARNATNYVSVSGIENCKALTLIHNNLSLFLDMLENGEIEIIETNKSE
ncbi:MAG: hypothetical protein IKI94_09785 [Ruminococcus sp.]|nr:hypothetical protein [Ruminococcus sp.]